MEGVVFFIFLDGWIYSVEPNIFGLKQNMRGGRVKLHSILNPPSEFDHAEKGDALYGKLKYYLISYN